MGISPGGISLKRSFVVVSMTLAAVCSTPVWAQRTAACGGQATESTDSIVQMTSAIRAANAAYGEKVRVADRIHDHEVAKARAERNNDVVAER
jgi:hypothetical protein